MKMIDTHTHYAHKRFDCGRDEILTYLYKEEIGAVIDGAIDYQSNENMKNLCETYPFVYMAAGCHPNFVEEMDEEKFQKIADLLTYEKVVAIGETGLDYAKNKTIDQMELQKQWFLRFIELSLKNKKPLVIHCREAYEDLLKLISPYQFPTVAGVIHSFSGNIEQGQKLIDKGFYMGVGGMFTKYTEDSDICIALKQISLDKIVLETDAPYLLPKGIKGKRNTSFNLRHILEELSVLRQENVDVLCETILENTKRVYPSIRVDFNGQM